MGRIKDFFSKQFDTQIACDSATFTTHYYANDYITVKYTIQKIAKDFGYQINSLDDHFKEIYIKKKKVDLIFTLTNKTFYETSVDIKVNTKVFFPAGRGKKIIFQFFSQLNKSLILSRKGLITDE